MSHVNVVGIIRDGGSGNIAGAQFMVPIARGIAPWADPRSCNQGFFKTPSSGVGISTLGHTRRPHAPLKMVETEKEDLLLHGLMAFMAYYRTVDLMLEQTPLQETS